MKAPPDYLNPAVPAGLSRVRTPIVDATPETLRGYGRLVTDPDAERIEIARWPAPGWRPVDSDSGDEGGIKEGIFQCEWRGDVIYGRNDAVDGHYVLGYGTDPASATTDHGRDPERILMWHANYHPDGGQLFFPLERKPFLVPLAVPGDDVQPEDFVTFLFDGRSGLYIHPNVWHDGVYCLSGVHGFFDRQGAVHARVSVDFAREFQCLLEIPLGSQPSSTSLPRSP